MSFKATHRHTEIRFTDMQFNRLVDFAAELAEKRIGKEPTQYLSHLKKLVRKLESSSPESSNGRKKSKAIRVERDFPSQDERKFWSCIFLDVSRGIFDRSLGVHHHLFWQAKAVHQAYALGKLFEMTVREREPQWSGETIDRTELNQFVEANSEAKRA